jgi:uncharacterized protein (TIGR02466 family)
MKATIYGMNLHKIGLARMTVKKEIVIFPLFPSMISYVDCHDFLEIEDDLIEWIYDYKKNSNKEIYRSNQGGWHSHDDLNTEKSFDRFNDYVKKHMLFLCNSLFGDNCETRIENIWSIVNSEGNNNASHQHPGGHMSGVLWVKSNQSKPEKSGRLIFENPNGFGQNALLLNLKDDLKEGCHNHGSFWFEPVPGRMILFPSDLRHHVENNTTSEDRIVISFNVMLRPKGKASFYNRAGLESQMATVKDVQAL